VTIQITDKDMIELRAIVGDRMIIYYVHARSLGYVFDNDAYQIALIQGIPVRHTEEGNRPYATLSGDWVIRMKNGGAWQGDKAKMIPQGIAILNI